MLKHKEMNHQPRPTVCTKVTKPQQDKGHTIGVCCFIDVKYCTFKSFITQSLQVPISASKVDRKWQFPQWLLRPTKLPVSSYFIWFPTYLTPPLRWALSISDIKDLSGKLSGLHNQSSNSMSAQSHTDVMKLQWQSVTWTWQLQCDFEFVLHLHLHLAYIHTPWLVPGWSLPTLVPVTRMLGVLKTTLNQCTAFLQLLSLACALDMTQHFPR